MPRPCTWEMGRLSFLLCSSLPLVKTFLFPEGTALPQAHEATTVTPTRDGPNSGCEGLAELLESSLEDTSKCNCRVQLSPHSGKTSANREMERYTGRVNSDMQKVQFKKNQNSIQNGQTFKHRHHKGTHTYTASA